MIYPQSSNYRWATLYTPTAPPTASQGGYSLNSVPQYGIRMISSQPIDDSQIHRKTKSKSPRKLLQWCASIPLLLSGILLFVLSSGLLLTIVLPILLSKPTTTSIIPVGLSMACTGDEVVFGVWNTTAGGDSTLSTSGTSSGTYISYEVPSYACNNNLSDAYTSYGTCPTSSIQCGVNTGFYRTPQRGASLITGLQVCAAYGLIPSRDPLTITFEGSNQPTSALNLGSSWTLLYSGTSGLDTNPGISTCGTQISFVNTIWYTSYRFLVTSKRGVTYCTWYSEVILFGY